MVVVRSLTVHSIEPFPGRDGYEWVRATAGIEVDSRHPANAGIVDLELAGDTVAFDCDVRLLRPTAPRGDGPLLAVVPNRGFVGGIPFELGAPFAFGTAEPPGLGDGFLLDRGWTVLWTGWQWDVLDGLGIRAPVVDVGPYRLRAEWRLDADTDERPLGDSSILFRFADYPTADIDDRHAVLTVRTSLDGERAVVPRAHWRFTDDTHVALDGGFRAFHWYELVYRTTHCPVTGTGLLAFRDVAAHMRATGKHDVALAYGVSQSGRFLRQFLYEGRNTDESGQRVFDGVFAHIASSRRGEFNHRGAQPSYTHVVGHSNLPPFATREFVPDDVKVVETNTAWEYWRGDGALLHVDPVTGDDLPEHPNVRQYLLAGHDHLGAMPMKADLPAANPVHTLDGQRVLRALFLALHRWVAGGDEPPPSAVPRRRDGTLVTREEVLQHFTGAPTPDPAVLNVARALDVSQVPYVRGERFVALVSDVDDTGNEIAGVRVPELVAGDAAYTGWNPRRRVDGLPDVLYEFLGSRLPTGRPPDGDAMAGAARSLVDQGFLLENDAQY